MRTFELFNIAGALILSVTLAACGSSPGGLSSDTDTTAPTISSSTPADGNTVGADATLSITFSEAMDASTVVISATDGIDAYDLGTLAWSADKTVATFSSPPTPLTNGATYAVTVDGKDPAGNAMESATISIAVEDAPKVMLVSPSASAADVSVTNSISLEFNVPADRTSVESALSVTTAGPSVTCLFSWSADSKIVRCNPSSPLDYSANYTIELAASAASAHSGPFSANSLVPSTFATAAAPDTTPPTVVGRDTTDDPATDNVHAGASVTIIFSEPVNQAQAQGAFSLSLSLGSSPTGAFSWDATGTKMTFNPSTDFTHGATGTWTVASGVEDTSGNPMASPATGTFKVVKEVTSEILFASPTQSGWLDIFSPSSGTVETEEENTYAGDTVADSTALTYYTFDLSTFAHTPVAVTVANLRIALNHIAGAPSLGYLRAQSLNYGTTLDISDDVIETDYSCSFHSPVFPMAKVSEGDAFVSELIFCPPGNRHYYRTALSDSWPEDTIQMVNVTSIVQYQWASRAGRNNLSQFRLSWDVATDGDDGNDYYQFYSATHANTSFRPALVVSYDYAW